MFFKQAKKYFRPLLRTLPDKLFVQLLYFQAYGRFPDLDNPRTFDEKMQWYKLYYRDPLMPILSDKYAVRAYLESNGHGRLLNALYGVWDSADEIDPDRLPERFVLKATHGSNMNIICRDKSALDWNDTRRTLRRWLKTDYFHTGRQWGYKGIRPRIICEKYLENEEFGELIDYKFYCYHGRPEVLFVCTGRYGNRGLRYNAYDMNWKRIHTCKGKPSSDLAVEKPDTFDDLVSTARELCGDFPFVRVDLYSIKNKIIFGELTFYPDNGVTPFTPDHFNLFFGDMMVLPARRRKGEE